MEIDYIVPLWKPDSYRLRNRASLEETLSRQVGLKVNLVIIEQDPEANPVFNKPWLTNRGVNSGKADHIFIGDVDVPIPDDHHLFSVLKWTKEHDYQWAFAWNRLLYEGPPGGPPERNDRPEPGIQEGGVVYFRRSLWERMGGANEWIQELRGPDNDLALRARYLTCHHVGYDASLVHKWHPRSPMKATRFRQKNEEILAHTRKYPREVIEVLRGQDRGNPKGPYCDLQPFPLPGGSRSTCPGNPLPNLFP